jgi:hypothetical protein
MKALLLSAGLALAIAGAAAAQDAPKAPDQKPTSPAAAAAPGATALKAGMPVVDKTGAPIGTISRLMQLPDGRQAVGVTIDGKEIGLLVASLTVSPTGTQAVCAMTKAEILASPG